MPAQTTTTDVLNRLGSQFDNVIEKHKNDTPEYTSVGELPAGIKNGVAQIVKCYCGVFENGDNKGKPFFAMSASVWVPEFFTTADGVKIKTRGKFTRTFPIALCDTKGKNPKTAEENFKEMMRLLHCYGGHEALKKMEGKTKNLGPIMAAIEKRKPFIEFSTRLGKATEEYPDPKTFHQWGELLPDYKPEDVKKAATQDDTEIPPSERKAASGSANGATGGGKQDTEKLPPYEEDDLDALAVKANKQDSDSTKRLNRLAMEAGYSKDEIDAADDWADVVEMIKNPRRATAEQADEPAGEDEGGAEQTNEPEESEPAYTPSKGDMVKYKPEGSRKAVTCEVTSVNATKSTVNLKNTVDGETTYKGVAWADLEG